MPSFRYRALSAAGEVVAGEMAAAHRDAVVDHLQADGHFPIGVEAVETVGLASWLRRDLFASSRMSRRDLATMTHELATLLQAGIPLDKALELLTELAESRRARWLLADIRERIRSGGTFADAVAAQGRNFPPLYVGMIRAGDQGGALETVLFRLADYLSKSQAARDAVGSALIYPLLLLIVAGLSLAVILIVVLPQFEPMFARAGASLPLPTLVVMTTGEILRKSWWGLTLGVALAALGHRRAMSRAPYALAWHRFLLRLPVIGSLITKTETARFSRTLGTLHASGVPLTSALAITGGTLTNVALARAAEDVAARLREGEGFSVPLAATGLFPHLAIQLMRVGEESGQLDGMLIKLADIYERDTQRTIERLLAMLTPTLTVLLGLLIAGVIVSVLVAILSVNDLAF